MLKPHSRDASEFALLTFVLLNLSVLEFSELNSPVFYGKAASADPLVVLFNRVIMSRLNQAGFHSLHLITDIWRIIICNSQWWCSYAWGYIMRACYVIPKVVWNRSQWPWEGWSVDLVYYCFKAHFGQTNVVLVCLDVFS